MVILQTLFFISCLFDYLVTLLCSSVMLLEMTCCKFRLDPILYWIDTKVKAATREGERLGRNIK